MDKKNILKIVLSLTILLTGIVFVDYLVGIGASVLLQELGKNNYSGEAAMTNYNLNVVEPDVVIIGSSTAMCHYVPSLLHDSLLQYTGKDLFVHNAGVSFQRMPYNYCELKSLVSRKAPRVAIVDMFPDCLGGESLKAALSPLHPYTRINPFVKEIMDANETERTKLLLHSNLYCYNGEIVKLLASFRNPIGCDGYYPKKVSLTKMPKVGTIHDTDSLNSTAVKEFEGLIKCAKENNVVLIVTMSPYLAGGTDTSSESYQAISGICKQNNIPLLDYSDDMRFQDFHLFFDQRHMNDQGAHYYTSILFEDIKKYLKEL